MSIPNIITLGRILLVPVIVWAIASNQMEIAFAIFIVAGVSDAVDGFLAKRFNMASELGALLDPLADKALLVSIYVALGIWGAVPRWIVILVVSRDIMIVAAVIVSWLFGKPIPMKPLMVSKLNTVAQVAFAALVLAALGLRLQSGALRPDPDGFRHGLYFGFRIALSRGVGAAHEYDRSNSAAATNTPVRPAWSDLRGRPRSTPSACICAAARGKPDPRQFSRRPGQCRGPGADRQLARLAEPHHAAGRARKARGKSHLAAIWAEQAGARSIIGACADRGRRARRAGDRRAGGRRPRARQISTSARCSI